MLRPADGDEIAAAFGLGAARSLTGLVARGEEGQVWRLETAAGTWAVKETFDPLDAADVAEIATFQEAAAAAGVTMLPVVGTPAGAVARTVAGTQVRVYGWVDLLPPDRLVDAAAVGRLLAAIHRTGFEGTSPVHPWYSEPVGEPLARAGRLRCSRRALLWRARRISATSWSRSRSCSSRRPTWPPATATCGPTTCCRRGPASCT